MFSKLSLRAPCFKAPSVVNNLKLFSSTTSSYSNPVKRPDVKIKHKTPQKRASSLYSILRKEEYTAMRDGRNWPAFRAGDSIEIEVRQCEICYIYVIVVKICAYLLSTCLRLVGTSLYHCDGN